LYDGAAQLTGDANSTADTTLAAYDGDGLRTAAAARHQDRFEMPRWSSKSRKTRIDASSSAPTEPVDSSS
jgi:hypothetical protein